MVPLFFFQEWIPQKDGFRGKGIGVCKNKPSIFRSFFVGYPDDISGVA